MEKITRTFEHRGFTLTVSIWPEHEGYIESWKRDMDRILDNDPTLIQNINGRIVVDWPSLNKISSPVDPVDAEFFLYRAGVLTYPEPGAWVAYIPNGYDNAGRMTYTPKGCFWCFTTKEYLLDYLAAINIKGCYVLQIQQKPDTTLQPSA